MPVTAAELDAVKQFLAQSSRAILITYRKDGGVQASPMAVVADDHGNVLLATRAANAKVKNLARNPRAAVCLITERFQGPWMTVEGEVEIERLPQAMPALADFYQRRNPKEDVQSDAFKERMTSEDRVLIRLNTRRVARSATPLVAAAQPGR